MGKYNKTLHYNNQSCIGWKHPVTTSSVGCFGVNYIQLSQMLLQGWCWLVQKFTTLLNKMLQYEKVGAQHLTNICCMAMLVTTFWVTAMLVGFFEIQLFSQQMLQRVVALRDCTTPTKCALENDLAEHQFFSRVATSASQRATREKN